MTQLVENTLVPVNEIPNHVENFFSLDRFQILWYDVCDKSKKTFFKPMTNGSYFGVRNIFGKMADGRDITVNLFIIANEDEMSWLRKIALTILGDYPSFQRMLTSWFCIGGCSYELDVCKFTEWLENCRICKHLKRLAPAESKAVQILKWLRGIDLPATEWELLRLAVYTMNWKDIKTVMGNGITWKIKHPCLLSCEQFEQEFISKAPLWNLRK